ncbi:hypothetical protein Scep_020468 [Stephania cephalantha]|uniref:RNase H type-1 domain-containing protein n=1 Tax=Stephania cephalantha TaxID=152367 RepID=A0AAP0ICN1_9MAGN
MSTGEGPSSLREIDEEDRQWKERMVAKLEAQGKQIADLIEMVSTWVSTPQAAEPIFSAPATNSKVSKVAVKAEPIGAVRSTMAQVTMQPPYQRPAQRSRKNARFGGYTIPNVAWSLPTTSLPSLPTTTVNTDAIAPPLLATQDFLESRLGSFKRKRHRKRRMKKELEGGGKGPQMICYQCERLGHVWANCDYAPVPFVRSETQGITRDPIVTSESDHDDTRLLAGAVTRKRPRRWVRWDFPNTGWVKLNVDGASKGNPGPASFGGVMRDEHGCWLFGYMGHIGTASSTVAELWAIREGLKLAWQRGFHKILLESDSQPAVQYLMSEIGDSHPLAPLINECLDLLELDWWVRPQHVLREGNRAADHLANMGAALDNQDILVLDVPPPSLESILTADVSGVLYER